MRDKEPGIAPCNNSQKGRTRSRSDSGVSCDSLKSSNIQVNNVDAAVELMDKSESTNKMPSSQKKKRKNKSQCESTTCSNDVPEPVEQTSCLNGEDGHQQKENHGNSRKRRLSYPDTENTAQSSLEVNANAIIVVSKKKRKTQLNVSETFVISIDQNNVDQPETTSQSIVNVKPKKKRKNKTNELHVTADSIELQPVVDLSPKMDEKIKSKSKKKSLETLNGIDDTESIVKSSLEKEQVAWKNAHTTSEPDVVKPKKKKSKKKKDAPTLSSTPTKPDYLSTIEEVIAASYNHENEQQQPEDVTVSTKETVITAYTESDELPKPKDLAIDDSCEKKVKTKSKRNKKKSVYNPDEFVTGNVLENVLGPSDNDISKDVKQKKKKKKSLPSIESVTEPIVSLEITQEAEIKTKLPVQVNLNTSPSKRKRGRPKQRLQISDSDLIQQYSTKFGWNFNSVLCVEPLPKQYMCTSNDNSTHQLDVPKPQVHLENTYDYAEHQYDPNLCIKDEYVLHDNDVHDNECYNKSLSLNDSFNNTSHLSIEDIKVENLSPDETHNSSSDKSHLSVSFIKEVRIVLENFQSVNCSKKSINLQRNFDHSEQPTTCRKKLFKFKYEPEEFLTEVTSSSDIFCGAQLSDGYLFDTTQNADQCVEQNVPSSTSPLPTPSMPCSIELPDTLNYKLSPINSTLAGESPVKYRIRFLTSPELCKNLSDLPSEPQNLDSTAKNNTINCELNQTSSTDSDITQNRDIDDTNIDEIQVITSSDITSTSSCETIDSSSSEKDTTTDDNEIRITERKKKVFLHNRGSERRTEKVVVSNKEIEKKTESTNKKSESRFKNVPHSREIEKKVEKITPSSRDTEKNTDKAVTSDKKNEGRVEKATTHNSECDKRSFLSNKKENEKMTEKIQRKTDKSVEHVTNNIDKQVVLPNINHEKRIDKVVPNNAEKEKRNEKVDPKNREIKHSVKTVSSNRNDEKIVEKAIRSTRESETKVETICNSKTEKNVEKVTTNNAVIENNTAETPSKPVMKPKHTFKFAENFVAKRPPSRISTSKISLNRPALEFTFKSPEQLPKREQPKTSKKIDKDFDIISIYANDSVFGDTVSIKSANNSDNEEDECDLNGSPVLDYLLHTNDSINRNVVDEWLDKSLKVQDLPKSEDSISENMTPTFKSSPENMDTSPHEIPVARVNPGNQYVVENTAIKTDSQSPLNTTEHTSQEPIENVQNQITSNIVAHNESTTYKQSPPMNNEPPLENPVVQTLDNEQERSVPQSAQNINHLQVFRQMCAGVKVRGECFKKSKCQMKHTFPPMWKNIIELMSANELLNMYTWIKRERYMFLFKKIFPTIAQQLGVKRDFNSLISLVKDVLEIEINSDRAPYINDIIQALCNIGFSFYSTVEVIFKSTSVKKNLLDLLSDILLNITVENNNLDQNWAVIQILIKHRNYDIDNGIVQSILIECLKTSILQKEFCLKVYNDLVKMLPDDKLNSVFSTVLSDFLDTLKKVNLTAEADAMYLRCKSSIIGSVKSDHSSRNSSPIVSSPVTAVKPEGHTQPLPIPEIKAPCINKVPCINNATCINKAPCIVAKPDVNNVTPTPSSVNFKYPMHPIRPHQPKPRQSTPFKIRPMKKNMQWPSQPMPMNICGSQDNILPIPTNFSIPPPTVPPPPVPPPPLPPYSLLAVNNMFFACQEDIRNAVYEENLSALMSLIMRFKDNNYTDDFLRTCIIVMIETAHNFPTFFANICHNALVLGNGDKNKVDVHLSYILKTIGVNLILHLFEINNWDQAYLVHKTLIRMYNDDIFNVKLYINQNYSFMKRMLIICHIYIKKNELLQAWNMLQENAMQDSRFWQVPHEESDIAYRNTIVAELLNSVTKVKYWTIALNMVQYLIKNNHNYINVKLYTDDILAHAINNNCPRETIMGFIHCSQVWYNYININTFRAIVIKMVMFKDRKMVCNLYEIGCDLNIYPRFLGNEITIEFSTHFLFEEVQMMIDIFLHNMLSCMPVKHAVVIKFTYSCDVLNRQKAGIGFPNILHQSDISCDTMRTRVVNILNNYTKPPITVVNENNMLTIDAEKLNAHLMGRIRV